MFWALAPVVSAFHSDAHAHRYCLEHRAFEEAGVDGGDPTAASARSGDETNAWVTSGSDGSEAHLACSLALASPRFVAVEQPRAALDLGDPGTCAAAQADPRGHPPIAHLDLAPKLSPPFAPAV